MCGTQVDRSLKQAQCERGVDEPTANMRCIKVSRSLDRRQLDVGGSAGHWNCDEEKKNKYKCVRKTTRQSLLARSGRQILETIRVPEEGGTSTLFCSLSDGWVTDLEESLA